MPASPQIREAIRQGSWIRKMFEDGAVLKAERGEENVFDFTLGNPYGEPPAGLSAELARLCAEPPPGLHRYMPNAGVPAARRAAALSLSRSTGLPFTEDLLVMTVGAAGALNVALRAILSPGDEVVIFAPYFVEYLFYIRNAGGTPVVAETDARAILINTPNNPTGAVYPGEDLAALDRVLSAAEMRFGNPIYVISDEPYRKIVFRGVSSTPPAAKIRNTLVAYSHSKDLNLPGERIGYLAVSPRAADAAEVAGACVFCNRVLGFVNAPPDRGVEVRGRVRRRLCVSGESGRSARRPAAGRIRRRPARRGVLPVPEIPRPGRDGVRRRGARRGDPLRPGVRVRAKRACPRRLLPLPGNGAPLCRRVGAARAPLSRRGDPAMTVVFRRNVSRMEGYVPGEQPRERGFIKLNTNENPYPPSPSVRKAILRELGESLRLYPDPGSAALRRQAALTYGFDLPGVIAGNG
ncbi:MAG: aspB, partial [Deltaproteobacteria bacterium]|nr:aspB [Deltaproteobacteria bacterium]